MSWKNLLLMAVLWFASQLLKIFDMLVLNAILIVRLLIFNIDSVAVFRITLYFLGTQMNYKTFL